MHLPHRLIRLLLLGAAIAALLCAQESQEPREAEETQAAQAQAQVQEAPPPIQKSGFHILSVSGYAAYY